MTKPISIKGAKVNNLRNVDVDIPKQKLVVVTGVSGSGKTSLVMDTLYAEGQRRYVESLSSYARQFLTRMKKPEVEYIKGICPAIALEQRKVGGNARSTVGSMTEIYDFLRLLFARVGRTYSPVSGEEVKRDTVSDVVNYIEGLKDETRVFLLSPLHYNYPDRDLGLELDLLLKKGFSRIEYKGEIKRIQDFLEEPPMDLDTILAEISKEDILILIDRLVTKSDDEELMKRVADSVLTAYQESGGECLIKTEANRRYFNNRFELDGLTFLDPTPQLFNYNNPYGACGSCEGFGRIMGIDEAKVVPDPSLSVYEGGIAPWQTSSGEHWQHRIIKTASQSEFPIHKPYKELSDKEKDLLWSGNAHFDGINSFFDELTKGGYKIQNRIILARYRGRTICSTCKGKRLRKEASYVKINDYAITDLINMPLDELSEVMNTLSLSEYEESIAKSILVEITSRLHNLCDLGLPYLHLDRLSSTLSGGESQRINLTKCIGSTLTSSMYILDEPSIGLHSRDTDRLINVMQRLRNLGNTVIVVEHEEEVIRKADHLIDIGPLAGVNGGHVIYNGSPEKAIDSESLTAKYLTGEMTIPLPDQLRKSGSKIEVIGAYRHNLKDIDATFKLNVLNVVTGVSGSGKSTLIRDVLVPSLNNILAGIGRINIGCKEVRGDLKKIQTIDYIDQQAIGKSSRSNAATYVKAYDAIRQLFASQNLSKLRGYKAKHFSFNTDGGRCETCSGDGEITIEMQFLADVKLVCEDCKGKRFKKEILEVQYKGKNIHDLLDLSIEESLEFFSAQRDIVRRIKPLDDVGLGYLKLGQATSTLSGGEAQRLKLASYLNVRSEDKVLFIFDEPTTGLHFNDIGKLLHAFNALIELGHSIIVIEHNLDVIKCADWIVDLGPEGGKQGGNIVGQGTPHDIIKVETSHTGHYLKSKLL